MSKVQELSLPGIVIVASMGLCSCGQAASPGDAMVVSAAISLRGPLTDIAAVYKERYRDVQIRLNFGSSGLLSSQIAQGAPVDVYASASVRFLDALERQSLLLPDSRWELASNRLVLIAPISSKLSSIAWRELSSIKPIAMGNPKTVPAGTYAKECLQNLGLWDRLSPRIVFAEHVRQVLDYVAREEVEAGLVYGTDALILPDKVRVIAEAPKGSHAPIEYGIAVVTSSKMPDAALRFVEVAKSDAGVEALRSFGFSPPGT